MIFVPPIVEGLIHMRSIATILLLAAANTASAQLQVTSTYECEAGYDQLRQYYAYHYDCAWNDRSVPSSNIAWCTGNWYDPSFSGMFLTIYTNGGPQKAFVYKVAAMFCPDDPNLPDSEQCWGNDLWDTWRCDCLADPAVDPCKRSHP